MENLLRLKQSTLSRRERHAQVRQRQKRKIERESEEEEERNDRDKGRARRGAEGGGRRDGDFVLGWCWHYPRLLSGAAR